MFVVPIENDTIETKDGLTCSVVEYTNYKEGGPAVYCKVQGNKDLVLVYFIDVESINGTQVELKRGAKVFQALGRVKRDEQLPQPDDVITVGEDDFEVLGLKLQSKALGVNKGLLIKVDGDNYYRLKQIVGIKRALGGDDFNRSNFLSTYKDYLGV